MKVLTRKTSRTVCATSAEDFDRKFNEVSESLGSDAELVWDTAPMTVHFIYKEKVRIPETVKEEYEEILGEHFFCRQCPYAIRGKDGRNGIKGCSKHVRENVVDYDSACEMFYKELAQGKIKPRED